MLCFGPLGLTLWAIQMVWIPFWAAGVINGLGHYWGYRNFNCTDASTNLIPWGILVGGEELHNNHHAFANSAKLSNKWYEFDIGWAYIRAMEILGLARVKKVAPRLKLAALRPQVDMATLQALLTHRYDLLARYARSLRHSYGQELRRWRGHLARPEWRRRKELQPWLLKDPRQLPGEWQARVEALLQDHPQLRTLYAMRQELIQVWERSSASREQLLAQLQDWCRRAEASGIRQLAELSFRLRRYAVS